MALDPVLRSPQLTAETVEAETKDLPTEAQERRGLPPDMYGARRGMRRLVAPP